MREIRIVHAPQTHPFSPTSFTAFATTSSIILLTSTSVIVRLILYLETFWFSKDDIPRRIVCRNCYCRSYGSFTGPNVCRGPCYVSPRAQGHLSRSSGTCPAVSSSATALCSPARASFSDRTSANRDSVSPNSASFHTAVAGDTTTRV